MAPYATSGVWKYFMKLTSDKAKCKICQKDYSTKGRTTTSLKNHLRSKHAEQYENYLMFEKKKETVPPTDEDAQCSIVNAFSAHAKTDNFDKSIAEMLALEDLPFSFVESIGFKRLIKAMQPRYKLRGRKYFTNLVCGDVYQKVEIKIKEIVSGLRYLTFTTDIWSEPGAGVSLLSLTCHGIKESLERCSFSLKCEPLSGSHTGDMLCEKIQDMLSEWNIPSKKIHCILRDGALNITRATNLAGFANISCVAHKLQLCIKVVLENEQICDIIAKCKNIATHFSHSLLAQEKLQELQTRLNQPKLAVIQDCATRWNSTFYTLQRFLLIKEALCLYASIHIIRQLSAEEWNTITTLCNILKPFEEITMSLCRADACISCVIPYISVLKTSLERIYEVEFDTNIRSLINELNCELDLRFYDLLNNEIFSVSTYLDPRFKCKFLTATSKENVVIKILNLSSGSAVNANIQSPPPREPNEIIQPLSLVQSLLCESLYEEEQNNNFENQGLKDLLTEYESCKKLDITANPLQWWKDNNKYAVFYDVVAKFLCAPPTTVASERLFSGAGLIYTDQRNRLDPEKAAKLLFIKNALKACGFEY